MNREMWAKILGGPDNIAASRLQAQKDEAEAQRAQAQQAKQKKFQQAAIVDPLTGKSMAGRFNPETGEYEKADFERGYAPRTDPETGYVLPASTAQARGMESIAPTAPPVPSGNMQPEAPKVPEGRAQIQPSATPAVTSKSPGLTSIVPEYKPSPVEKHALDQSMARLSADPVFKENKMGLLQSKGLLEKTMLAQKNPAAFAQIGAEVAKLYESGRLTDEDVVRYVRDPSLKGQWQNWVATKFQGTLNPQLGGALREALALKVKQQGDLVNQMVGAEADRAAQLYKVPPDFARRSLQQGLYTLPPSVQEQAKPAMQKIQEVKNEERVPILSPDGRRASVPRSQLEQALKQGFKLTQ